MSVVYLIERVHGGFSLYWPPTTDAWSACRFSRRVDAERAAKQLFGGTPHNWIVVEHSFDDGADMSVKWSAIHKCDENPENPYVCMCGKVCDDKCHFDPAIDTHHFERNR